MNTSHFYYSCQQHSQGVICKMSSYDYSSFFTSYQIKPVKKLALPKEQVYKTDTNDIRTILGSMFGVKGEAVVIE